MREKKYRVWDKTQNKMIHPDEIWIRKDGSFDCVNRINGIAISETDSLNAVLLDFTGLLDKSGKEIFEGDIVKSELHAKPFVVEWDDRWHGFDMIFDADPIEVFPLSSEHVEIIGNIYENKNLIK